MTYTRAQIVQKITQYNDAEDAVLKNKSYTIDNRSMTRADLVQIREGRQEWELKLLQYDTRAGGGNSLYSVSDFSS